MNENVTLLGKLVNAKRIENQYNTEVPQLLAAYAQGLYQTTTDALDKLFNDLENSYDFCFVKKNMYTVEILRDGVKMGVCTVNMRYVNVDYEGVTRVIYPQISVKFSTGYTIFNCSNIVDFKAKFFEQLIKWITR